MSLSDMLSNQPANAAKPIEPKVSEEDYFIPDRMRPDIEGLILTVQNIADFGEMGHRNYLFTGLQGTGKTLGSLYIATRLNALVYDAKFMDSPESVQQTFAQLRMIANKEERPLFVIINEIDKFSRRNDTVDPRQRALLNTLLDEMQGFEENKGIYVIGTTNRPNDLDPALRRPGRFDKEIEFLPPDHAGRRKVLDIHAKRKGHKFELSDEQLAHLASKTYGYTGADLRGLLNETFIEAMRHSRKAVTDEDIDYGLKHTKPSAIKDMPFREPSMKLDDLVGYSLHKDLLRKIVAGNNGMNMLFYGPPGTGKSVFAEALAGEYGYNLMFVSGSELESKWVGETKDRLAEVYNRAKHLAPCVIVLDEIDSFVENKGWTTHQKEQSGYMQSILSKPIEGVYIVATTNNPQYLREVMLDRFAYKLYFGLPSKDESKALLRKHIPAGIDIGNIKCESASCRDIVSACQKAQTYGALSPEKISQLLKNSRDETGYMKLVQAIGDDVMDYAKLTGGK